MILCLQCDRCHLIFLLFRHKLKNRQANEIDQSVFSERRREKVYLVKLSRILSVQEDCIYIIGKQKFRLP